MIGRTYRLKVFNMTHYLSSGWWHWNEYLRQLNTLHPIYLALFLPSMQLFPRTNGKHIDGCGMHQIEFQAF